MEHLGDLVRFMVSVTKGTDWTVPQKGKVVHDELEGHGNKRQYSRSDCDVDTTNDTGTHVLVSAALDNHSYWNGKTEDNASCRSVSG